MAQTGCRGFRARCPGRYRAHPPPRIRFRPRPRSECGRPPASFPGRCPPGWRKPAPCGCAPAAVRSRPECGSRLRRAALRRKPAGIRSRRPPLPAICTPPRHGRCRATRSEGLATTPECAAKRGRYWRPDASPALGSVRHPPASPRRHKPRPADCADRARWNWKGVRWWRCAPGGSAPGEPAAFSFAIMTILASGISMYALGLLLHLVLGWSFNMSVLASAAIVLAYTFLGGLTSAIYNEVLQFLLIVLGFAPLAILAVSKAGGWEGMKAHLADHPEMFHAWRYLGSPTENPMGVEIFSMVAGLGFVLSFGYWCTNFLVVQRAMAAVYDKLWWPLY